MSSYFVTGASGAVGSAIIPLLLDLPDADIHLLLRADSDAALRERLEELLVYWGWSDSAEQRARIHIYRGDAVAPQFGLTATDYGQLVERCTHLIHCAGAVRMNLSLEKARHSAVDSVQEILALARLIQQRQRLAKVEVVSTVGVAGRRVGTLPERWINEVREFHNTYEQSKAEAEVVLQAAVERERLPITVHRPSMVIGDSRSGRIIHFQIFYFISEFLSGRKSLGVYPDLGQAQLDLIPVDVVARAIVASSQLASTSGMIFNQCSGPLAALRLQALRDTVHTAFVRYGLPVPTSWRLSSAWFGRLVRVAARLLGGSQGRALATLPIYLDYLRDEQLFGNDVFHAWLRQHDIDFPTPEAYLPQALRYYLEHKYPGLAPRPGSP